MSASAVHKHIASTYIQIVSSVLTRTATRIFALPPVALPLLSSTLSLRELCSHWSPRSSDWGWPRLGGPPPAATRGPIPRFLVHCLEGRVGGGCKTASRGRLDNFLVSVLIRKPLLRGSLLVGPWQSTPRPLANLYRTPKSIGCEL